MTEKQAASHSHYDAIIVGGGNNGLVCANYLAREGRKVLVLERRHIVGGAAVTEEFTPGFRASIFSYMTGMLHPRIIRDFDLPGRGYEVLPCSDMIAPVDEGEGYILFSGDMAKTQASFRKFSEKDADIYPAFDAYLREATEVVRQLLW
ncbi:phytoene desaturase family protein, partial [Agrobacterium pusense]